jgi:hypothetical protein
MISEFFTKIIDLINLRRNVNIFSDKMFDKMRNNYNRKGISYKYTDKRYLEDSLKEHLELKHYLDVANYCFMLYDLGEKS